MLDLSSARKKGSKESATTQNNSEVKVRSTLSKNANLFANTKKVIESLGDEWTPELSAQLLGLRLSGKVTTEKNLTFFPMPDGTEKPFILVTIPWEEIQERTTAAEDFNDRDQAALNEISLADILPTLSASGNFFPGVSNVKEGVIKVLDGSRRRYSCYLKKVPFRTYIPADGCEVTFQEAKYISNISELQKTLSYREKGFKNKKIMAEQGYKEVKDLALYLNGGVEDKSLYEVLRLQINAAEVSEKLISLIPDYNSLSVRDFKSLYGISNSLNSDDKLDDFISKANQEIEESSSSQSSSKIAKDTVKVIEKLFNKEFKQQSEDTSVKTPLFKFDDKTKKAYKVEKNRSVQFNFTRVSQSDIKRIEDFIVSVLAEGKDD